MRKDVIVDAWVEDLSLTSNGSNFSLSEVESLVIDPQIVKYRGKLVVIKQRYWNGSARNRRPLNRVEPVGLAPLFAALENQEPNFDRSTVTRITVGDIVGADMLPCAVVASEADRSVARHANVVLAQDSERPTLETVSKGEFIQPRRSESPVTLFCMLIPSGNPLSEVAGEFHESGEAYNFGTAFEAIVGGAKLADGKVGSRSVRIGHFTFRPPGLQDFEAREYVLGVYDRINASNNPLPTVEVRCPDFAHIPKSPEILRKYPGLIAIDETVVNTPNLRGKLRNSRFDIQFTGRLRVWEFELDKNPIPNNQRGGESAIRRLRARLPVAVQGNEARRAGPAPGGRHAPYPFLLRVIRASVRVHLQRQRGKGRVDNDAANFSSGDGSDAVHRRLRFTHHEPPDSQYLGLAPCRVCEGARSRDPKRSHPRVPAESSRVLGMGSSGDGPSQGFDQGHVRRRCGLRPDRRSGGAGRHAYVQAEPSPPLATSREERG